MISCLAGVLLCGVVHVDNNQDARVPQAPAVVELFEDDVEGILKVLTNPNDAPGNGQAEGANVFSGSKCLKVTEYQKFQRRMPGWNYLIREKPGPGEYRYLRFAWRTEGSNCLMLQLHDAKDWYIRYTAGNNVYGWESKLVAAKAPEAWTLVTIDLFKDFGDRTLTGIAFTIHGGAGYFDHVYLGRTIDDLDRIDVGNVAKKRIRLERGDLDQHWQNLAAADDARKYQAFWKLVAGREQSESYLKDRLAPPKLSPADDAQIRMWLRNLDSSSFVVRTKAAAELKKRAETLAPILEAELKKAPSAETRRRLEELIAEIPSRDLDVRRRQAAQRILAMIAE